MFISSSSSSIDPIPNPIPVTFPVIRKDDIPIPGIAEDSSEKSVKECWLCLVEIDENMPDTIQPCDCTTRIHTVCLHELMIQTGNPICAVCAQRYIFPGFPNEERWLDSEWCRYCSGKIRGRDRKYSPCKCSSLIHDRCYNNLLEINNICPTCDAFYQKPEIQITIDSSPGSGDQLLRDQEVEELVLENQMTVEKEILFFFITFFNLVSGYFLAIGSDVAVFFGNEISISISGFIIFSICFVLILVTYHYSLIRKKVMNWPWYTYLIRIFNIPLFTCIAHGVGFILAWVIFDTDFPNTISFFFGFIPTVIVWFCCID